jgi:translation initiation factor IF-3|tara:strand:- start:117 stop:614 length:498 start_codon:yes stop_codon:yes gene_type:complete
MIRVKEVNVVGDNGDQLGVLLTQDAINMAQDRNLDLVEVAPNSNPPVCRVMDYSKFKYQQSKRAQEAKKKQKIIHVKEVKFRPNTDQHDYNFKLKNALRFLEAGDKVKILVFFRGREIVHRENGQKLLARVTETLGDMAVVEQQAKQEGKTLCMIFAPKGLKKKA